MSRLTLILSSTNPAQHTPSAHQISYLCLHEVPHRARSRPGVMKKRMRISPKVLPFSMRRLNSQANIFADATALDVWVLDQLRVLFKNATEDAVLDTELRSGQVIFFLHLLGLDTTGHSYRPHSSVLKLSSGSTILPNRTLRNI